MDLNGLVGTESPKGDRCPALLTWAQAVLEEEGCLMLCEGGSVYVSGELSL